MTELPVLSDADIAAMKKPTLGGAIGRFSIVHGEHERMFRQMAAENDHVIILLGSANRVISPKNPFSFEERVKYITAVFAQFFDVTKLRIVPLNDRIYAEGRWETTVDELVSGFADELGISDKRISMYGNEKDRTGYWHRNFPQWKQVNVGLVRVVNATELRQLWFQSGQQISEDHNALQYLPPPMKDYLRNQHVLNPNLQSDWAAYMAEEETFKDYPYREALNVMCGDAVVECAGHILTVTRAKSPGLGQRALPGGHKESWETAFDCAIRELYEETNLRVPERTVRNAVVDTKLFDHPSRNIGSVSRSTLGVHIKLEPRDDGTLPRAKGGDDAKNPELPNHGCDWIKISDILSGKVKLFDDHSDIVDYFAR
jgi:bifunctional NMN adenylyltransferase/nudix hydrolase